MTSLREAFSSLRATQTEATGQSEERVSANDDHSPLECVILAGLSIAPDSSRGSALVNALRRADLDRAEALAAINPTELKDALAEAGLRAALPAKSHALIRRLADWFNSQFPDEDDARNEAGPSGSELRESLIAINGVGLATADEILLALGRPTFPVDRASYRILYRHGWIDSSTEYDDIRDILLNAAGDDPLAIHQTAEAIARIGRQFCVPRAPKCEACPLEAFLPSGGPVEADG